MIHLYIYFSCFLQTIGIDSEFCLVESLVTGIVDMWPEYLRPRRRLFTSFVCLGLFILGIPMVTNGGAYVFQVSFRKFKFLPAFFQKRAK